MQQGQRRQQITENPVTEAQVQQQPQPRRVASNQPTAFDLIAELREWLMALERAGAGFRSMHLSLASVQGQVPEGERKKGLPIFTFPASVNGRDMIDCVADLKKVDPQYISHVLVPLINSQAIDMVDAVDELIERLNMIRPAIYKMAGLAEEQPQPAAQQAVG